jgi:hypothetical protein
MLIKVETGPANEKIVKDDGSCAKLFFFFYLLFWFKKKRKKKKGERNYVRPWFGIFQTSYFLGKDS